MQAVDPAVTPWCDNNLSHIAPRPGVHIVTDPGTQPLSEFEVALLAALRIYLIGEVESLTGRSTI